VVAWALLGCGGWLPAAAAPGADQAAERPQGCLDGVPGRSSVLVGAGRRVCHRFEHRRYLAIAKALLSSRFSGCAETRGNHAARRFAQPRLMPGGVMQPVERQG
jgi:hypothetical protein